MVNVITRYSLSCAKMCIFDILYREHLGYDENEYENLDITCLTVLDPDQDDFSIRFLIAVAMLMRQLRPDFFKYSIDLINTTVRKTYNELYEKCMMLKSSSRENAERAERLLILNTLQNVIYMTNLHRHKMMIKSMEVLGVKPTRRY